MARKEPSEIQELTQKMQELVEQIKLLAVNIELVGVADCMQVIEYHRLFMEAQGHKLEQNIINQDNKSAILLRTNGCMSCSKRSNI